MGIEESLQELLHDAIIFVPRLIGAIVVFGVALFLSGRAAVAVGRAVNHRATRAEPVLLLQQIVRWSVITLGTVTALSMVDFDITGFAAGLGVTGLVVGLALQDIARNFVAGVILMLRQPYHLGQAVSVAGVDGTVVDVNTRDTTIRRWDGEMAIIPNSTIFTSIITNYSQATLRQRTIRLEVNRMQDPARTIEAVRQAAMEVPGVTDERDLTVWAEGLGPGSMILAIRFWVDTAARGLLEVHSDVVIAVNDLIVREGIGIPYPTRTIQVINDAAGPPTNGQAL